MKVDREGKGGEVKIEGNVVTVRAVIYVYSDGKVQDNVVKAAFQGKQINQSYMVSVPVQGNDGTYGTGKREYQVKINIEFKVVTKEEAATLLKKGDVSNNFYEVSQGTGTPWTVTFHNKNGQGENVGAYELGARNEIGDDASIVKQVWRSMVGTEAYEGTKDDEGNQEFRDNARNGQGISNGQKLNQEDFEALGRGGLGNKPSIPQQKNKGADFKVGNNANALKGKKELDAALTK